MHPKAAKECHPFLFVFATRSCRYTLQVVGWGFFSYPKQVLTLQPISYSNSISQRIARSCKEVEVLRREIEFHR